MKNDFMVAINQVCNERQLPVDVVLEAVETALVSAYKRNYGANTITAKVDSTTGSMKIFVQKEVVEDVLDDKNEISLAEAQQVEPEADIGSVVQIESTPNDFGRIAAQTTKQVILQRIREAEREAQYRAFAEREGEIISGVVHKADHNQVVLSLDDNVEAYLPRNEQMPNERYGENQRLRAYISEVTRTPRGPHITVSRTHRNLLKRLLEVEVPEIYNGTVEVKAIAREAGFRSKIAVAALQEGVDPVGSCVGMRGVRIQSIVNELNGEKIDVAEWSADTRIFIANALSPAKVLNVVLQDITSDKTALVVVPDRQLSLAIGKEGQNARLAAKLTGWRIDIKSAVEAARESINQASASAEIKELVSDRPEVFSLVASILEEKSDGGDMSQGELQLLSEAIELVEQAKLRIERRRIEAEKAARRKAIAEESTIDILAEAEALLGGGLVDDEADDLLDEVFADDLDADLALEAELGLAETPASEALSEATTLAEPEEAEEALVALENEPAEPALAEADSPADPEPETPALPPVLAEAEAEVVAKADEADEAAEADKADDADDADDADKSGQAQVLESILDDPDLKGKKKTKKAKKLNIMFEVDEDYDDSDDYSADRKRRKSRTLRFDEETGEAYVKRRRKRSRARDEWEEYLD